MQKVRLEDMQGFARQVLERVDSAQGAAYVLALQGDLGAGKTTFTQALAKELGVEGAVQSPTYVLMKSYSIAFKEFTKLVHIDAYRLEKPEEFAALKPASFLQDQEALVVVEWPERVQGELPKPNLTIQFSANDPADVASAANEEERYIEIV